MASKTEPAAQLALVFMTDETPPHRKPGAYKLGKTRP
jgi:hypothetical protein